MKLRRLTQFFLIVCAAVPLFAAGGNESGAERDVRMQWWREARFGLFIHWGLYAVPAGEWDRKTDHGEWIRTTARIPLKEYDGFLRRFNPRRFDPDVWVKAAKDAGMKYIVITTKHHDGFCLFDTKQTEFSVLSTPFRRDIMKALSAAAGREGIKICWYYSIMDWHHPDYLPRREWETARSDSGADFRRYVRYMKSELKELLTNYGPVGVLWFDGEWESTWNTTEGRELYDYVRSLQPGIIINNRVGGGRSGMEGFTKDGEFSGDFGTPEQEVPATGLKGVDWETCMTMNDHWGYNSHDAHWKSSKELIRTLADVASKGGNFLLNVGPTSDGVFPQASIDRLGDIGAWMRKNGGSIYGTSASPFRNLPWGRCTERRTAAGTLLYLHIFDWPSDGRLLVPGLLSDPRSASLLAGPGVPLPVTRRDDAIVLSLPLTPTDSSDPVIVLEFDGVPEVNDPPVIAAAETVFVDRLSVAITSERRDIEIRYTLDGSEPGPSSLKAEGTVVLTQSETIQARAFRGGRPVSPVSSGTFTKVIPLSSLHPQGLVPGVSYLYYHGDWDRIPDFAAMTPLKKGKLPDFETPRLRAENYGFVYDAFVSAPARGVYSFFTESDDGSRLSVDDSLVVDNDGLHGMSEKRGVVALEAGLHALHVAYFNKTGGAGLGVSWRGPGFEKSPLPGAALFCRDR
jgi:alpha-L-fucosidase